MSSGGLLTPAGASRGLWLMLAIACVSACGPVAEVELEKPEVYVKGVTVTRVGTTSADVEFLLSLRNPNASELDIYGINYDVSLNNRRVLLGDSKQELTLPAYGVVELPLRASFDYQSVFSSISEALRVRRVVYQLNGSAGIGSFRIPFAGGGEFVLE